MKKIKQFQDYLVKKGIYKSKNRFSFRAKQIFRNIDLKDKTVLEIGCGEGIYSIWARLCGSKHIVGLEPEVDGCTLGSSASFKELINFLKLDGIECLPVTIEQFMPGNMKFDIVLSNSSINHWEEEACINLDKDAQAQEKYLKVFRKVKSLMQKNGKLIILDNSSKNFFGLFGKKSPFCQTIDWRKHQPPEVWVRLLKQVGFSKPKISWPSRYSYLRNLYCAKSTSFFIDSFFRLEMEVLE